MKTIPLSNGMSGGMSAVTRLCLVLEKSCQGRLERIALVVDGEVCQVHLPVSQVIPVWRLIGVCTKTRQAISVEVHCERVHARHEDIHAHVPLVPIDQHGSAQELLDDKFAVRLQHLANGTLPICIWRVLGFRAMLLLKVLVWAATPKLITHDDAVQN